MRVLVLCLAVFVVPCATFAQVSTTFWSSDGDAYVGQFNANGAKLVSKYPKSWYHGEPSEDHIVVEEPAVIFLGKSCDANHSALGTGKWGWWNDNFHAEFGAHSISFVNQELFDHRLFEACQDHG